MEDKDTKVKEDQYKVNSRISLKLTKKDADSGIIDFLNVQDNVSKAIKEGIKQLIKVNGIKNISANTDIIPTQKVIEAAIIEALLDTDEAIALADMYKIVADKLKMSPEAKALKSENSQENVYEKRLRFATVSMKQRGILESGKRGMLKLKPFLRQFKKEQIANLDSIVEALELNMRIKESNL